MYVCSKLCTITVRRHAYYLILFNVRHYARIREPQKILKLKKFKTFCLRLRKNWIRFVNIYIFAQMNIQTRAASSFDRFIWFCSSITTEHYYFRVFQSVLDFSLSVLCFSMHEWFWKLFLFIKVFLAKRGYEFLFCVLLGGGLKLSLNVSMEFHVNFKNHLFWEYDIGLERKDEPQCHISR